MRKRRHLLFLQLPQLDNEVRGPHENVHAAAAYLHHSLAGSEESAHWRTSDLDPDAETLDDAHLVQAIVGAEPSAIACTLYLWNIERTLAILKKVRALLPALNIVAGGPEAAADHPFLYRAGVAKAVGVGEGEPVFPAILRALRIGGAADLQDIFWRGPRGYARGRRLCPAPSLAHALPPPGAERLRPDANGMAYMETSRGCPLACTYCRYHHFRSRLSWLAPNEVARRVSALRAMGAREIRFIDPTMNAHPAFGDVLRALKRANRSGSLRFFGEMRADTITSEHARWLAAARFTDVEVGVQSTSPRVLRAIRRPGDIGAVEQGIRRLTNAGVHATVDLMYGLPEQTLSEFRESLKWALRFRRATVQCLQTLLLPGTDLRVTRRRWRIEALDRPPYGVLSTATMPADDIRKAEEYVAARLPEAQDCMTLRFVGSRLPDLFEERVEIRLEPSTATASRIPGVTPDEIRRHGIPGCRSRRALIFRGPWLWNRRDFISDAVRRAIVAEPHMLWQFVLAPESEEPLDLLDVMIAAIGGFPPHLNDRYASAQARGKMAARRVMILLRPGGRFSRSWVAAAERFLRQRFV